VYDPALFNVCPFHEYGNCVLHTVMFVLLVLIALIVTFKIATESQPFELFRVAVYVPPALIDWPFQAYGNWLGQRPMFVVLAVALFTVRFSVAMLSQLLLFVNVTL